jgi:hypothetical protein
MTSRPLYTNTQTGVKTPVLALPLRVTGKGTLGTVEQGSAAELAQRIAVLCRTPPGWIDGLPDFGLADQTFSRGGADVGLVEAHVERWVPDVQTIVNEDPSMLADAVDVLGIQVATR